MDLSVDKSNAGGLVLDLDGEALGIALSGDTNSFTGIDVITVSLKSIVANATVPANQ